MAFNEQEQKLIFENHIPGESFISFRNEVQRFNLGSLLPNPQFLKMFADAYLESHRVFSSKQSIFEKAVDRLAREANYTIRKSASAISVKNKILFSSEIFTILYLSGAEGVSTSESTETRMYPSVNCLLDNRCSQKSILSTRLFRPGVNADHHIPAHKIIAEYCVANLIASRIKVQTDHLSIEKCLTIIAPNNAVRDDLRGVLGWLASRGDLATQEAIITIDPHAVLANGDPSQLHSSSKRLLIDQLERVETIDPYFRRGDYLRNFSLVDFFDNEVIERIKPLLLTNTGGQLRGLLLEMLSNSTAIKSLIDLLLKLTLSSNQNYHIRQLSADRLLEHDRNILTPYLLILLEEASHTSLEIATGIIKISDPSRNDKQYLVRLFFGCASLYPTKREYFDSIIGNRYFIKHFFQI